ncbi:YkvI family membrane protein [Pectinatus sottacetonis]|uniref:YkvI family membrane protein n=1 Tax=Pectinatus sottacetonis TaxID=1002795 RepID=UPI0018C5B23F|nr:hypothetical protein [Pectinatus sottacetonis]
MNKDSISIKKLIILAGALSAYWIGSGFATGQEALQFFAVYGINGILGGIIFLIIMSAITYILYGRGQINKFKNPYDIFEYYCGKLLGQAYIWYSITLIYCIFVVMLAGGGATINQYFGMTTYVGTGIIGILALGTALLGVEKLIDIIGVIGPVKIVFLAIIGLFALKTLAGQPTLLLSKASLMPVLGFKAASSSWLWSATLYAFLALIVSIPFQINCGASANNLKEARISGIIGTLGFTIAIILLVIGEIVYNHLIVNQQVPTLAIARYISPVLGLLFSILIVVSIYSAVASFLLMVVRKFAVDKTKKFNIIATVLTFIGVFFGGIIPFDELVNILYPFAGYSAIVFVCFMTFKEVKLKITNKNY